MVDISLPILSVPLTGRPRSPIWKTAQVSLVFPRLLPLLLAPPAILTAAREIVLKHRSGQVIPLPKTFNGSPLTSGENPSSPGLEDRLWCSLEADGVLMGS